MKRLLKFFFAIMTATMPVFSTFFLYATPLGKAPKHENLKIERNVDTSLHSPGKEMKTTRSAGEEILPAAPAPLTDIITDPAGTIVYYEKESAGTFVLNNFLAMYKDSFPAIIVWGNKNKVYFKNLLSVFPADYYLEGIVEGNTITMKTNQTIAYYEEEGYGINFGVFKTVRDLENGEEVVNFKFAPEVEEIEFTLNDDGGIEMVLPGEQFDGETPPEYVAGLYFTDDYSFTGYCDFSQTYERLELEPVEIPEGAEMLPYVYIDTYSYASIVDVAIFDGYLYIRGLSDMIPEGTIKAEIKGDKAIVNQNEYLGIYFDQFYIFTKVLYDNPDYNPEDENSNPLIFAPKNVGFELTLDMERGVIYADTPGVYLSYHCDDSDFLNSLGIYGIFEIKYQSTFAGTPSNPVDLEYTTEYAPYQGFNDFFFTLSNFSTEGTLLDVDKLYYKVFVEGQPLVFCEEVLPNILGYDVIVYEGVPMKVELLPYNFNNNQDIFKFTNNAFDIGIYIEGLSSIGVQSVYFYEEEFTYSDIVTLDIETGQTTVTPGENAGVKSEFSDEILSTEYFTLAGQRVSHPDKGIYICKTTMADGTVKFKKIVR